jgi:hypothetical protein
LPHLRFAVAPPGLAIVSAHVTSSRPRPQIDWSGPSDAVVIASR